MKFLLDNNLPPALAAALDALTKAQYESHSVIHLASRFDRSTSDALWIDALFKEGGWTVISQDRFRKGNVEREAVRRSGLVIFCLDKTWSNHTFWDKSHNLLRWWPPIIQQAELIAGGAAFRVPWRLSGTGRFEQIKLWSESSKSLASHGPEGWLHINPEHWLPISTERWLPMGGISTTASNEAHKAVPGPYVVAEPTAKSLAVRLEREDLSMTDDDAVARFTAKYSQRPRVGESPQSKL